MAVVASEITTLGRNLNAQAGTNRRQIELMQ
jgi:hypothetical protein